MAMRSGFMTCAMKTLLPYGTTAIWHHRIWRAQRWCSLQALMRSMFFVNREPAAAAETVCVCRFAPQ
jgi:hypothetical protein